MKNQMYEEALKESNKIDENIKGKSKGSLLKLKAEILWMQEHLA